MQTPFLKHFKRWERIVAGHKACTRGDMTYYLFFRVGAPRPVIDAHFTVFGGGRSGVYPPTAHADGGQMLVSVV